MKLTKIIPEHTKTITAEWLRRNFTVMTPNYRKIRQNSAYQGFRCYWCKTKFQDGDQIALACISKKGNKVFCDSCAKQLENSDKP